MGIGISPPVDYKKPGFPSLNVDELADTTPDRHFTLYDIGDVWHFAVLWTLFMYLAFHLGAILIAFYTHSWNKRTWRLLWVVPVVYLFVAAIEALIAGSLVGLMCVLTTIVDATTDLEQSRGRLQVRLL